MSTPCHRALETPRALRAKLGVCVWAGLGGAGPEASALTLCEKVLCPTWTLPPFALSTLSAQPALSRVN